MVTADSVREAGIAAHLAVDTAVLPEPSIYFQDFNFGGTMFDALFGNAEALGGVGAGISDVALEERMALEAEDRKKDDPAADASMIAELATRQREEIIRIGRITATRTELLAFSEAMKTSEFRAAFRQHLIDEGVPVSEVDERLDAAERLANVAPRIEDGTATAAERSQYEIDVADPRNVETLERGIEFNAAHQNLRYSNRPVGSEPVVPVASETEVDVMAMMDAGASGGVTNVADRQGPVISNNFEMAVNGVSEPAPLTNVPGSTPTVPQNNAISFG